MRTLGKVAAIWRYPVKSMAGEALERVDVSWNGLVGDRRWAFVRDEAIESGFPWLTLRDLAEMRQLVPSFVDPDRPDASKVIVRTPDGARFDVMDPALVARLGEGVRVIKQNRGAFDTMPLSLITRQSVAALAARVGAELDVQRFRPNFLVDAVDGAPFVEDTWVGRTLRVGALRMRVDKRDQRCVIVNLDPATNERNAAVLKTIARDRESCVGVYGTTVEPGRVAVGDAVAVEE